jgi:hypothetical protein
MTETSEDKIITSKVLFDGTNAKDFFSSIKIILALAKVLKVTNFVGNEKNTLVQHQQYLNLLNVDGAEAKARKDEFDRARLIIDLNIHPSKRPSFERYDAFQFLQMLYQQCANYTYLQQSLEISNRLDAVRENFSEGDQADLMLLEYSSIHTQAISFGNGLATNLGSQLFNHASKISKELKDHLNIWQATISGDPESFTFEKVHDKIRSKLNTLNLQNQLVSTSSYLAQDAPAAKSCDHHTWSKSHTTAECSITKKLLKRKSDFYTKSGAPSYYTKSGPPAASGAASSSSSRSSKAHAWHKSKAKKKPYSI